MVAVGGLEGRLCLAVTFVCACVGSPICLHFVGGTIAWRRRPWGKLLGVFPIIFPSLLLFRIFFLSVIFVHIFIYLFFCLLIFSSTKPSSASVTGACWGSAWGGSWLGCRLGRPVRCSGALCVTVVAAPGPLEHLTSICNLIVNLLKICILRILLIWNYRSHEMFKMLSESKMVIPRWGLATEDAKTLIVKKFCTVKVLCRQSILAFI